MASGGGGGDDGEFLEVSVSVFNENGAAFFS